jgi:ubiquinone/menaquinone biosynthesis C-methylase UbiE
MKRLLSRPTVYDALQRALGSTASDRRFVGEHVRPAAGDRVLDLACGTGRILGALPDGIRYLGFDVSPEYIDAARRKWGSRGEFHCADVREVTVPSDSFERVLMMGVLHHLDDESCQTALGLAARALTPDGRLVAIDGVRSEREGRLARLLVRSDRGCHVRRADEYAELAQPFFGSVNVRRRDDLLRVAYPHVILECRH